MRHLVIAALLLAPALTRAEPKKDVREMHTDDCAKARKANKTCVLDMGKEVYEGGGVKKPGDDFTAPVWGKASSLIRLRRDFIVEILKSAEDL